MRDDSITHVRSLPDAIIPHLGQGGNHGRIINPQIRRPHIDRTHVEHAHSKHTPSKHIRIENTRSNSIMPAGLNAKLRERAHCSLERRAGTG